MAIHTGYGIKVGGNTIGGITTADDNTGIGVTADTLSSQPYSYFSAVNKIAPKVTFTTKSVYSALGICGLLGVNIKDANLTTWSIPFAEAGLPTNAGAISRTYGYGVLVPRRLSWSKDGDATLDYEALCTSDPTGTYAPVVIGATSPPALTGLNVEVWTLYSVSLQSVAIGDLDSMSLDFGIDAQTGGSGEGGSMYDLESWIRKITPTWTFGGMDVSLLNAAKVPLTGKNVISGTVVLAQRDQGGGLAAGRLTFTTRGILVVDGAASGSSNDPQKVSLKMTTRHDGTNLPIVVAYA